MDYFVGSPVYSFFVPKNTKYSSVQAEQLVSTIASSFPKFSLEIVANQHGIIWQVVDISRQKPRAFPQIPGIEIQTSSYSLPKNRRYPLYHRWEFAIVRHGASIPIMFSSEIDGRSDPLATLVQGMSLANENEEIRYSLLVTRRDKPIGKQLTGWIRSGIYRDSGMNTSYSTAASKLVDHKLRQPWYGTCVGLVITTPSQKRTNELFQIISPCLENFDRTFPNHPYNGARFYEDTRIFQATSDDDLALNSTLGFYNRFENKDDEWKGCRYFELAELASLWHLPHEGFAHARVVWQRKIVPVSDAVAQASRGIELGRGQYNGNFIKVRATIGEDAGHTAILGKTGFGKSTLLHHLIHQRIQSGSGVAVIDPHGSLVHSILQTSIPSAREHDVVVIDLADTDFPPPLNPLRGMTTSVSIGRAASIIAETFKETDQRVRVSKYLSAALATLQVDGEATMRDIGLLFTDDSYRARLLKKLDDFRHAQAFDVWGQYEAEKSRGAIYEPIYSRISPFYKNGSLYPIFCHPDGLNFRKLIHERKIILISLKMDDEEVADDDRNLVGSILISTLQLAGTKNTHDPFYLYIDEAEKFVTTSLKVLLSEARKFGMSLTLANQYAGQLAGDLLEAVEGNVTTTICFGCSIDDARSFAPYFAPEFEATDLLNFDKFETAVKLQQQGKTQSAFTVFTNSPLAVENKARAAATELRIREFSRLQYTPRSLDGVKAWLRSRYPRPPRSGGEDDEEDIKFSQ